jgi:putative SOS response-associated peptidase YedK
MGSRLLEGDLMRPYPAEPMRIWPISTPVNKPENDRFLNLRADQTVCCVTAYP